MDKDISILTKNSDDLTKAKTQQDVNQILTGVIDKLSKLKRKADDGLEEEVDHLQSAKRRLDYLRGADGYRQQQQQSSGTPVSQATCQRYWERRRITCMMVDYFLRHGLHSTAQRLAKLHDVEQLTNLPYFAACQGVEKSLMSADTSEAVAWCTEHRSKLRKLGSNFEYSLRLQDFVKLVQQGRRLDAVKYARKHLSPEADTEAPAELLAERNRSLCEAMGLLALPCDKDGQPPEKYRHLTEPAVWHRLVDKFRQVNCAVFSIASGSIFCANLQTGLSALKTNQCGKEGKRCLECPVCQPHFGQLAQSLPKAQYTQSKLICPISRLPMDHDNPPMALPNGNIYSQKSLLEMAQRNGGYIICPRTQNRFELNEAKRSSCIQTVGTFRIRGFDVIDACLDAALGRRAIAASTQPESLPKRGRDRVGSVRRTRRAGAAARPE
uniref:E3 ubiquitin-protein transferase MAEA n=1 Tax=Macrostomum lignano TaxID=282301 RepID=A0A1I8FEN0_9PLAT